jgi:hypothetical protein
MKKVQGARGNEPYTVYLLIINSINVNRNSKKKKEIWHLLDPFYFISILHLSDSFPHRLFSMTGQFLYARP